MQLTDAAAVAMESIAEDPSKVTVNGREVNAWLSPVTTFDGGEGAGASTRSAVVVTDSPIEEGTAVGAEGEAWTVGQVVEYGSGVAELELNRER